MQICYRVIKNGAVSLINIAGIKMAVLEDMSNISFTTKINA